MNIDIGSISENNSLFGYLIASRSLNFNITKISKNFDEFCVGFLNMIINNNHKSLKHHIKTLVDILNDMPEFKPGIHYAIKSILSRNSYIKYLDQNDEMKDIYGSFKGFFLLTYIPEYSYLEIVDILYKEGNSLRAIYIASGFIGAYLGHKKLIRQGIKISIFCKNEINQMIKMRPISMTIEELKNNIQVLQQELNRRKFYETELTLLDKLNTESFIVVYKIFNRELFFNEGYDYIDAEIPVIVVNYAYHEFDRNQNPKKNSKIKDFDLETQSYALNLIMEKLPVFDPNFPIGEIGNEDYEYEEIYWEQSEYDEPYKWQGTSYQTMEIWFKPYSLSDIYIYGIRLKKYKDNIFLYVKIGNIYKSYQYIKKNDNTNLNSFKDLQPNEINFPNDNIHILEGVFEFNKIYDIEKFTEIVENIIPL
jgi:hypothetical protein